MSHGNDLDVLNDLLDDPAFPDVVSIEKAVCAYLGLELPEEIEVPRSVLRDEFRAREHRGDYRRDLQLAQATTDAFWARYEAERTGSAG